MNDNPAASVATGQTGAGPVEFPSYLAGPAAAFFSLDKRVSTLVSS